MATCEEQVAQLQAQLGALFRAVDEAQRAAERTWREVSLLEYAQKIDSDQMRIMPGINPGSDAQAVQGAIEARAASTENVGGAGAGQQTALTLLQRKAGGLRDRIERLEAR